MYTTGEGVEDLEVRGRGRYVLKVVASFSAGQSETGCVTKEANERGSCENISVVEIRIPMGRNKEMATYSQLPGRHTSGEDVVDGRVC